MKYSALVFLVPSLILGMHDEQSAQAQLPEELFTRDTWLHIVGFMPLKTWMQQAYRPKLTINQAIANKITDAFYEKALEVLAEQPTYEGNKISFTKEFTGKKKKFLKNLSSFFASCPLQNKELIHASCTKKVNALLNNQLIISPTTTMNFIHSLHKNRQLYEEAMLLAIAAAQQNHAIGGRTDIHMLHELLPEFNWHNFKAERTIAGILADDQKYTLRYLTDRL